jgi:hypothetical protein
VALEGLSSHGGTDLVAAVERAARLAAAGPPARERRVVLLTDGDPDAPPTSDALSALRRLLDGLGVRFGAVVRGDAAAAARLRDALADRSEEVVLLGDGEGFASALRGQVESARRARDRVAGPLRLEPVVADLPIRPDGHAPEGAHVLELADGARLLAEARLPDGARVPFAAERDLGAGRVVALAFGPEGESDRAAAAAWIRPLLARMAVEADRGVAGDLDGGEATARVPSAAGRGRLSVRDGGTTVAWAEVAPGLFRGALPPGEPPFLMDLPEGLRPLRLPARPPPEHRGAGVDEGALRALAEAGGGERLAAGERPPRGRPVPGPSLAPWLLAAALGFLIVERARVAALLLLAFLSACAGAPSGGAAAPRGGTDPRFHAGGDRTQERMRALAARVPDASPQERLEIGRRISAFGEPATPVLLEMLRDPNPDMRELAAWVLGFRDDRRVLPALVAASSDPVPTVALEAAAARLRLDDPGGIERIVAGLEDPDPRLRSRSALLLQRTTGTTFDFQADASPEERAAAVARWRDWLERRRAAGQP